jgi:hypothetical protein
MPVQPEGIALRNDAFAATPRVPEPRIPLARFGGRGS